MSERKRRRRTWSLGLIFLFVAVATIVGVSVAYFSDVILGTGSATAGTLDLTATNRIAKQWYTQGGTEASSNLTVTNGVVSGINNLNPGDIIEISYDLKNVGNKSAWLRDIYNMVITPRDGVSITTAGMFEVYKVSGTTLTTNDIRNNTTAAQSAKVTGATSTVSGIANVSSTPVIYNGTGANAETETSGVDTTTAQAVKYYIYFKPSATNEYQNASISFSIRTEAIQYRNNAAAPDWSDATSLSSEFQLTA